MTQTIVVDNVSKQYRIGEQQHGAMLRETLMQALRRPFRSAPKAPPSVWALRDVSLAVEEGEIVGLIGRNGAGKTTLLKLLARITYPTAGNISVRGRIASLVEVGTGFHQELTGRENIYLNGSILGLRKKEIDQRFDDIVEFAGVSTFIDTPLKRYSSGMRLRLGFAVAAHLSPDVLLVDEVLSVGDVDFQRKCLAALDNVRGGSRTVLFVSHNLEAVEQLCPRTIWIDHGRIRQDGNSREVIAAYLASVSDAHQASLDLAQEEHRSGSGEIRYIGLEYLDLNKQPKAVVRSGEALIIRLHYTVHSAVQKPHFGVKLHTELGTLVSHLNTWNTGFDVPNLVPGVGFIDLTIDCLNLTPGRYYLSLWIESLGAEQSYDLLEHSVVLDIDTPNVSQSGRQFDHRSGFVFFPCSWEIGG